MDDAEPLFDGERDALIASVSDGKREFYDEQRKVGQYLAEVRKKEYIALRACWQLLNEIENDAVRLNELNRAANHSSPYGLMGAFKPGSQERIELSARLREVLAKIRRISDNYTRER